jgi:hypothetical protein
MEVSLHTSSAWIGEHDIYATLVDMAVLQRDETGIRQYVHQAEEFAMRYEHTLYQAVAHRARGVAHRLAGEYPEAETRLNQALDLFVSLHTRWQMGRTLFELGELAVRQKNIAAARECFAHAQAAFEEMHAAPDATRTQAALERLKGL